MTLPAHGTVSYNGYTFGPETLTTDVSIKPVDDAAGRTSVSNHYSITIESWIIAASGSDNDSTLENIKRRLTAYGGEFRYQTKGLGDLTVNVAGGRKDVKWGPKPKLLRWQPKGRNLAAKIVWQVEFQTLDCTSARFDFDVMEFAFKVDIEQSRDRLTKRTYTGHLTIPQTRRSATDKRLTDTADLYYDKIVPPIPLGFRRENERRSVSEDKCRLDFSFVDAQMKAPLPPGIMDMDIRIMRMNSKPNTLSMTMNTITARYEVALHWPLFIAQKYFADLYRDRMVDAVVDSRPLGGGGIIPSMMSVIEEPQNRVVTFTAQTLIIFRLDAFFFDGMFRPVIAGRNAHTLWQASLSQAFRSRGYTREVILPDDDVIIDLCRTDEPYIDSPIAVQIGQVAGQNLRAMTIPCPRPELSWIYYEMNLIVTWDDGTVIGKPLPVALPRTPATGSIGGQLPPGVSLTDVIKAQGDKGFTMPKDEFTQAEPTFAQHRTSQTIHVYLVGRALRACYQIPMPQIVTIGGSPVVPNNRADQEFFAVSQVANTAVPIFAARWQLRWTLTRQPKSQINPTNNPTLSAKKLGILAGSTLAGAAK